MASTNYVTKINKQPIAASQVAPNSPLESKLSNMEATIAELEGVGAFAVVPLTSDADPIPDPASAVPPVELSTKIIYLTKDAQSTAEDPYTEWIYIEGDPSGSWQIIGTTSIDVSDYVQKVAGGNVGHLATLTADGGIADSGKVIGDFATKAQGDTADTAVQEVTVNGGANLKSGTSVNIPLATTSADGAMSAADKGKLDVRHHRYGVVDVLTDEQDVILIVHFLPAALRRKSDQHCPAADAAVHDRYPPLFGDLCRQIR